MRKRHLRLIAVVVIIVVAALSLAACGGTTASTTAAPTTTAGEPTTTAAGPTTTAGAGVDVAALYTQYCGDCHDILPNGSAAQITSIVQSGKQSMPGFTDKMTPDQITALATWVANGGR